MTDLRYITEMRARVTIEDVARIFSISGDGVSALIRAGLLRPLGNPAPNAPKYFAAVTILRLTQDEQFLDRMSRCLQRHWKQHNQRKLGGKTAADHEGEIACSKSAPL